MTGLHCVCIAGLVATACGTDGITFGPEMAPTAGQRSGIMATEQGLTQLADVESRGSTVSIAAAGVATSALQLIVPDAGRAAPLPAGALGVETGAAAPSGVLPGVCAVVGDASIVWHKCLDAGFTIDGMIGWGPGHVTVRVGLVGSAQGVGFDYTLTGGLLITPSSLLGDIRISGNAIYNNVPFTQEVGIHVDAQLAQDCISSGELAVTASGSGAAAQNGAALVIWTGCRTFRVRNG
jgi:hypothetical protein